LVDNSRLSSNCEAVGFLHRQLGTIGGDQHRAAGPVLSKSSGNLK
jgi:hypothetical protein